MQADRLHCISVNSDLEFCRHVDHLPKSSRVLSDLHPVPLTTSWWYDPEKTSHKEAFEAMRTAILKDMEDKLQTINEMKQKLLEMEYPWQN